MTLTFSAHIKYFIHTFTYKYLLINIHSVYFTDVNQVCKNGDVENEFHFVCICKAYTTLRNTMYD